MYGGGAAYAGGGGDGFKLGDIGDFRQADDLWPIASASFVSMNVAIAAARLGGLGGISLNTYFDTFGLEGFLSNAAWLVILFQVARWLYTTFYSLPGSKPWSPVVFLAVLVLVQLIHDLIFYFGLINILPSGRNDMVDALKKYAKENGSRALAGHAAFLALTGLIAMWLKETTFVFSLIVANVALYLLPFVITTLGPKPPPPPPPPKKQEAFGMPQWNGPRF
jgi:hypothetical protein